MDPVSYNFKMLVRATLKRSHTFHACVNELGRLRTADQSERWARQISLLEHTLAGAARSTHYGPLISTTEDFKNPIEKLKTLPYLEKETVRTSPRSFSASRFPALPASTSGTTGTPLKLRRSLFCAAREEAGFFAWHHSAGWRPDDLMIVLRGDLVVPVSRAAPPYGIRDIIFNRWVLSSYHLSDDTMPWYIELIRGSGARFLSAYPSSAYILADFLRRYGEKPLGLQAVFLASESVFEHQRSLIAEYIGPVHAQYGNAERVTWMTTCPAGHYHEDISYGYTEYVPIGDDLYEIVASGFINRAMPLLRYCTGDLAVEPFSWDSLCICGRPGPGCQQIIGRRDDVILTPGGRRIGRLDHIFKGVSNVIAAQIVQTALDTIEIRIVRAPWYSEKDEQSILHKFIERVGNDISVSCSYVNAIPRSANGKFRAVVSHVV